jgi:hypothetical protein
MTSSHSSPTAPILVVIIRMCLIHLNFNDLRIDIIRGFILIAVAGTNLIDFRIGSIPVTGPRGKSFFSAGFSELTDTRLGKEDYAAADHMLLIGRTW